MTGAVGYYWAFEKVGFAVKSSERYYAKVKPTSSCAGARSPVLNAEAYGGLERIGSPRAAAAPRARRS